MTSRRAVYRSRVQLHPPRDIPRWWLPRVYRSSDEWCNDAIAFVVPPAGELVVFWRPGLLRAMPCRLDWLLMGEEERADYAPCGWLHGGRLHRGAHHHVTAGVCDAARIWLTGDPRSRPRPPPPGHATP